jgi:hypothetical protein
MTAPDLLQLGRQAIASMSAEEIVAARAAGSFTQLLGGEDPDVSTKVDIEPGPTPVEPERPPVHGVPSGARGGQPPAQLRRGDIAGMSPAEIVAAMNEGRLEDLRRGDQR